MTQKFKEAKFSLTFQKELFDKVTALVNQSLNICLVSMKGIGSTIFFKYLASSNMAKFVYIDCHLITFVDEQSFYKLVLKELGLKAECKNKEEFFEKASKEINRLFKKGAKIVLIFNHFNHLEKIFDQDFFDNLRNLQYVSQGRLLFIFHLYKPILAIIPERKLGFNVNLFARVLFLKPYSTSDLVQIARVLFNSEVKDSQTNKAIFLSAGHCLLLQLLLRTGQIENPLLDPFIKYSLREQLIGLSYQQRKTIGKITEGNKVEEIDQFLLNTGFVKKEREEYRLFTPLLYSYIKSNSHLKFSANEEKLFKLLKKNQGKLVSKEQLFSFIWGEDCFPSDWALNSLIYRLRKNSVFKSLGYIIESYKKRGYILIKD